MYLQINGAPLYCHTGGQAPRAGQPTAVFVHGVLGDHSVWALHSRWFARHGWNVLAIDLPGHCRSRGAAPQTVEQAADCIAALLAGLGAQRAALIGHSWGSLIALDAAARLGARISHLVLIGTAFPMRVAPALMAAARTAPAQAIRTINVLARSTLAAPPALLAPGTWPFGAGMALAHKVLRSNPQVNLLELGLAACDGYGNGLQASAQIACPALFILGAQDRMTAPRAAQALIDAARAAGRSVQQLTLPVGHNQMGEAPEQTQAALRAFLT